MMLLNLSTLSLLPLIALGQAWYDEDALVARDSSADLNDLLNDALYARDADDIDELYLREAEPDYVAGFDGLYARDALESTWEEDFHLLYRRALWANVKAKLKKTKYLFVPKPEKDPVKLAKAKAQFKRLLDKLYELNKEYVQMEAQSSVRKLTPQEKARHAEIEEKSVPLLEEVNDLWNDKCGHSFEVCSHPYAKAIL